jgi:hypothetical protein
MSYLGTKPQTATQLASGIVTTESIADGAVGTADIAASAVTPAKLSTGAPTWDSSGNVGIGTSTPAADLEVKRTGAVNVKAQVTSAYEAALWLVNGGGSEVSVINAGGSNVMSLRTNNTERMRIDSSGNLLLNTTSTTGTACMHIPATASKYSIAFRSSSTTGSACAFFNSSGGGVGEILINASSTTYATSSDYRLKENIAPMTGALATVSALKPVTYTWKSTGEASQGFIAHELQAVVPDCVTGEKDAVDADGNPVYQGIDTSFLVATLTAAIQEQQAIITSLEARLTALESK